MIHKIHILLLRRKRDEKKFIMPRGMIFQKYALMFKLKMISSLFLYHHRKYIEWKVEQKD